MKKYIACLTLILTAAFAQQEYRQESQIKDVRGGARLHVTYPPSVKEAFGTTGQLKVSLGNFGHIQYGTTIGSHLTYDATNVQGCLPFESYFPHGQKIVLVEAGGCPIT